MSSDIALGRDQAGEKHALPPMVLGALGVVYGDIGTSPLYTLKTCFNVIGSTDARAIYGVLSLVFWALTLVITIKYVIFIMRADNHGEGGILALTALAQRAALRRSRYAWWIAAAGIVGSALFYGDGVVTPAISVLSAVEGLKVATPLFENYVIPITLGLLLGLFLMQHRGSGKVGGLFGPVMVLWFAVIGILGLPAILHHPRILRALDPLFGLDLLAAHPWTGFALLGGVVLAVTGGEALYADMGHFGRTPIRLAWFSLVLPALILNYFGQGANLLANPLAVDNPFFRLAPGWAIYPLVILASAATVIASQAVISGAFSLTRQAIQLGYLPRMDIRHTSETEIGQIFVPSVNRMLMLGVFVLVVGFRSSDNLAAAYGIAVTGTMTITTILAFIYMRGVVGWSLPRVIALFGLFLVVDLAFFSANLLKLVEGGWFPLAVAAGLFILMTTWRKGRGILLERIMSSTLELNTFIARSAGKPRVPGTAVYMTSRLDVVPVPLLHNLKHNKVLHERIVLMKVETTDIPREGAERCLEVCHLDANFHTVVVHYGFMEQPNLPKALKECRNFQLRFNLLETSFFLGHEKIIAAPNSSLSSLRRSLFITLQNNALSATEFFRIPANRVVELGGQIEI